ncbi:hypothetical protein AN641_07540 [Candidatus Epulonipiscioides gigas]|nr:hypothetical protein AN641_07540 [Epulopiscium sp. SCG-C07WGA-EpuloA2]
MAMPKLRHKPTCSKKLNVLTLSLMVFTIIFSFSRMSKAFYYSGYGAIFYFIIGGLFFFLPYSLMLTEYGITFNKEKGGIYGFLKNVLGEKIAFIATSMWYFSFVILITNLSFSIWIPLSNFLYGQDISHNLNYLGLEGLPVLGLLCILLVIATTIIVSFGITLVKQIAVIGGTFVLIINVILIFCGLVVFLANDGVVASGASAIILNKSGTAVADIELFNFVICTFFGMELIVGLCDEIKNAPKALSLGIGISSLTILGFYFLGILILGIFLNWEIFAIQNINLENIIYLLMNNLGYSVSISLGASANTALKIGMYFEKFMGLSVFFIQLAMYFIILYSPLKQFFMGTPSNMWPKKFGVVKNGVPINVLIFQATILIVFIAIICIGGGEYFKLISLMTLIPSTIPCILLAFSFPFFKTNEEIKKPIEMFKTVNSITIFSILITFLVIVTDIVLIGAPLYEGQIAEGILIFIGPFVFTSISYFIYSMYEIGAVERVSSK